jgi:hypothetical protein
MFKHYEYRILYLKREMSCLHNGIMFLGMCRTRGRLCPATFIAILIKKWMMLVLLCLWLLYRTAVLHYLCPSYNWLKHSVVISYSFWLLTWNHGDLPLHYNSQCNHIQAEKIKDYYEYTNELDKHIIPFIFEMYTRIAFNQEKTFIPLKNQNLV